MNNAEDFMMANLLRHPCTPTTQTGEQFHKHQCPNCGETWAHLDALPELGLPRNLFDEAHTCPTCGTKQYFKVVDHAEEVKAMRQRLQGREVWSLF